MVSKVVMQDRDEFLRMQREMTEETEKVLDATLQEFNETADANNSKAVNEYLADFNAEVAALRAQIKEIEKDTTLNSEALRLLITSVLSGEKSL